MRFWKKKRVHPPLSDIFVLTNKSILEKKIYLDPRQNGMHPKHCNNKMEWIQRTAITKWNGSKALQKKNLLKTRSHVEWELTQILSIVEYSRE